MKKKTSKIPRELHDAAVEKAERSLKGKGFKPREIEIAHNIIGVVLECEKNLKWLSMLKSLEAALLMFSEYAKIVYETTTRQKPKSRIAK